MSAKKGDVVKITTITDREKWDAYIKSHPETNFLQSWDFYEFHRARGKTVVRRAAVDGAGKIVAAYAGVVETAKRGTYMAVAGGPVIGAGAGGPVIGAGAGGPVIGLGAGAKNTTRKATKGARAKKDDLEGESASDVNYLTGFDILPDKELAKQIFADMREQGAKNHCVFIRVRPQWELSEGSLALLAEMGLKRAPMFLSVEYAGVLDLAKTEEEILAGASQGLRRKIRKAKKENLEISAETSDKAIEEFCELEKKHAERQKYVAFSSDFLHKQYEAFREHGEVKIYTARKDGEILAQNFMIFYGAEASYHYGVSSELGTRISAAPLLHMAAMADARERGCLRYNLWGIVGREEREHRFFGVSEFKRSFGCEELKYTPAHDLVLEPVKYQVTKLVETARKKHRHV